MRVTRGVLAHNITAGAVLLLGVLLAGVLVSCGGSLSDNDAGNNNNNNDVDDSANLTQAEENIAGLKVIPVPGANHVDFATVEYSTNPPAGGDHWSTWHNCGFYTAELVDEFAVHSIEHGAVWATYKLDTLTEAEVALDYFQDLAEQNTHFLASPNSEQAAPIVLTAWGRQLELDSHTDERFVAFLDVYLGDNPTAPEAGASCFGQVGIPPDMPTAYVPDNSQLDVDSLRSRS